MKQLTLSEKKIIDAALLILQESKEPIARRTLRTIKHKQLNLCTFAQLTRSDWKSLYKEGENKLTGRFPIIAKDVQQLNRLMWGLRSHKNIYLNLTLDVAMIAQTLVHEVTHYSLKLPHDSSAEVFVNESSAFVAEELFAGKRLSRHMLFAVGVTVNQLYQLAEDPKRLSLAADSSPELPKLELRI